MASLYFADQKASSAEIPWVPNSNNNNNYNGDAPTDEVSRQRPKKQVDAPTDEVSHSIRPRTAAEAPTDEVSRSMRPEQAAPTVDAPTDEVSEGLSKPESFSSSVLPPQSLVGKNSGKFQRVKEDDHRGGGGGGASVTSSLTGATLTMAGQVRQQQSPAVPEEEAWNNGSHQSEEDEHEDELENGAAAANSQTPSVDKDDNSKKKKSCTIILLSLLCCLLVAGGIGAGVGIALSNKAKNDPKGGSGDNPSQSPGEDIKPTEKPKHTEKPESGNPDDMPDYGEGPAPPNDNCNDAVLIESPTTITGANIFATPDAVVASCGGSDLDAPGVWYQVIGKGTLLTARTCGGVTNFDTKLEIFRVLDGVTGSCSDSGILECMTNNDDAPCATESAEEKESESRSSSASWWTEPNVPYYILVKGHNGARGQFSLTLREENLSNDNCDGAIPVFPDGGFTPGSTIVATRDYVGICDGVDTSSPGVWYSLEGTGDTVVVSTCHKTYFDTKLSVFQGSECGRLTCMAANDDAGGACQQQAQVSLETEVGTNYYILVHGYENQKGSFHLHVATPENRYNDFCGDARPVAVGEYAVANNAFATFDFSQPTACPEKSGVIITGPTVWFSILGTGGQISASLCDAATNFDTLINVFVGDCDALQCLDGNDDGPNEACGFTSEISWNSEPFENYLVAVHGYENATGNIGLFVTDLGGAPSFDSSANAGGPVPKKRAVSLQLADAAAIDSALLECNGNPLSSSIANVRGVWLYTFGDGGDLTASICDENPSGTKLLVFRGDNPNSLVCINTSGVATTGGTPCDITWSSEADAKYYLFVEGVVGFNNYEIYIDTTGPPNAANDLCENAFPLEIDAGGPTLGDTYLATLDVVPDQFCGEKVTAPGVWYSVVGNGVPIAVGLCRGGDGQFDTKISVFSGSCTNLVCIGGNDDFCDLKSAYEWPSEVGVTYYVLVHGFEKSTGDFGIMAVTI